MKELISVIIPSYNAAAYVGEAIDSVLAQAYDNIELILVDDGSTDHTAEVARQYADSLRYIYQENGGIGAARNTGVRASSGNLLAFLDADDIWVANKLVLQLAAFARQPELDVVYGHARQFYSPEVSEEFKNQKGYAKEVMPATLSTAMLIKRDSFLRVGYYQEGDWIVDQQWYLESQEAGVHQLVLDDILYLRRIHENNHSIQYADQKKTAQFELAKRALQLKRAGKKS